MEKENELQYLEILMELFRQRRVTMLARREKEKSVQKMYEKYMTFTRQQQAELQQLQWEMELLWQRNVESCKWLYRYLRLGYLSVSAQNLPSVATVYTLLQQGICDNIQQATQVYEEAVKRQSAVSRLDDAIRMADRLPPIQSELQLFFITTRQEALQLAESDAAATQRINRLEKYQAKAIQACETARKRYSDFEKKAER